jgi:hypothetical protein
LVASNVTEGNVWIIDMTANYFQTYVLTGAAKPTGQTRAQPLPKPGLPISADVAVDVYVMALGNDGEVSVSL